jgi:hypothetical protein
MAEKDKGQMPVREAGRKGGETTSREHGPEFYHEIGTKGGHKVRELIRKGEESEGGSRSRRKSKMEDEEY